jgi:hypothetical protein
VDNRLSEFQGRSVLQGELKICRFGVWLRLVCFVLRVETRRLQAGCNLNRGRSLCIRKSRRFVQIMFSKAKEYVEHCVHVCKAAVSNGTAIFRLRVLIRVPD